MGAATGAKRGRPATASRDEVLRAATDLYLAGDRLDLTIIARRRVVELVAQQLESLIARKRRQIDRRGAAGLLDLFDAVNRSLARASALRRLLEQERGGALRLLTSSGGVVQPRAVACITALIEEEVAAGGYEPALEPATLAYAIVRLCEAFLYNDAAIGIRGDYERLREVEAALLGVPDSDRTPALPS